MVAFRYRAINSTGKVVKGTLEGDSERQVRGQLRTQKLKPISVDSARQKQQQTKDGKLFSTRLSAKDLTLLTRQMASLIQSGMPLVDALQGVAKQARKQSMQSLVLQIRSRILEGMSFAQALSEHPRSFSSMYRAMINAGEQAGFLGPVMERLAIYTETSQHAKQKLLSAMIYPMVLMLVCVGIVVALMTLVVPQLITVFQRAKTDLPGQTEFLIAMSEFLRNYGLYCGLALMLGIIIFRRWLTIDSNLRKWHKLLLKLPLTGHIIVESDTARFAGTVAMLLDSGVPLLQALRISSQTMGNLILREQSERVAAAVQEGASLNRALDQAQVFPPLLVQMAASGEMNGTLADQLQYAARSQERELDLQLSTAMSIVEPVTIITMAVIVGFIMYAILTPIFGMSDLL
ncbi:MAG: general secretion pathway protein F [Cellvibrionaceae bacterium]|jgi:general secretion pathway protein F